MILKKKRLLLVMDIVEMTISMQLLNNFFSCKKIFLNYIFTGYFCYWVTSDVPV